MRKNYIAILILLLLISILSGCTPSESHTSVPPTTTYPPISYHEFYAWSSYSVRYTTVYPLVSKADYVLLGTVTDISFEAYPYRPDAPDSGYGIQTIYTIKASQYFQGNSDETVTLVVPYGIQQRGIYQVPDYLLEEQRKLAWEYGITEIHYPNPFPLALELGETYVFILGDGEDGRMVNVSPEQYAFNVNDTRNPYQTHYLCYEDFVKYYDINGED